MDDLGVYHGQNVFRLAEAGGAGDGHAGGVVDHVKEASRRRFKSFLMGYHDGDGVFKYQEQLRDHVLLSLFWIEIRLDDLTRFDEELADKVRTHPNDYMAFMEEAAREVADAITRPRVAPENIDDMQIILKVDADPIPLRDLKSDFISKIQVVSGIVISASNVRAKATKVTLQCRSCKESVQNLTVKPGLEGFLMPRKCSTDQTSRTVKCPVDPYFILPNKCQCHDFQLLKLQETPESVPYGEMPRHLRLYVDRYLCEQVVPGNRITCSGILTIKPATKASTGVRQPYLRVLGMDTQSDGPGRSLYDIPFSDEEKMLFRHYASSGGIYEMITRSLAPSIYGSNDIKKAIACLLFGGSRKKLPDGLNRRGDINVLLLGDPGTAKSQLLKFVEKVSPIGVYTSGKGSSAAGLTASVIRDPQSHNFVMEGGAMVLADGGVVCIDEFDKMREDDRVAIHEAMEQQTISIAKAGITCTLNSRCAVLAAANSVFGRWDDTRGDKNIDFMPTILSRFDMIFIVKDEHDMVRDAKLAEHVFNVHNKSANTQQEVEGELPLAVFKKYIAYCRSNCGPRLSPSAAEKLKAAYVRMRNNEQSVIPITVRQLEAVVRIAEALAKMELRAFAEERHVDEALRLFKVSTLAAASTGNLQGAEGFTSKEDHEELVNIEHQIKKRLAVNQMTSEKNIVQDIARQRHPETAVMKVIQAMVRRGELQYRAQQKMLYRLK